MIAKLREQRRNRSTVGDIGVWLLHIVFATYAIYSMYHGINATSAYRAVSGPWAIAGIIGIISIELKLAGLYLAAITHKVVGTMMKIVAGTAAAVGFAITVLNIIGDSQMNAGLTPPPWLHFYLTTILPAAPFVAALGSFLVLWFSPWAIRRRAEAEAEQDDAEDAHMMELQIRQAERDAEYATRQVELDTKMALAEQLNRYAKSEEVQGHIAATVAAKGPGILRAAGLIIGTHAEAPPRLSDSDVTPLVIPMTTTGNSTQAAQHHDAPPASGHSAANGPAAKPLAGQGGKPADFR